MERKPLNVDDIATLAKTARLDLPEDRYALQAETLTGIFQMLDALDGVELGETPPAFAYRAKWEPSK